MSESCIFIQTKANIKEVSPYFTKFNAHGHNSNNIPPWLKELFHKCFPIEYVGVGPRTIYIVPSHRTADELWDDIQGDIKEKVLNDLEILDELG